MVHVGLLILSKKYGIIYLLKPCIYNHSENTRQGAQNDYKTAKIP